MIKKSETQTRRRKKVLHITRQLDFGGVESVAKIIAMNGELSEFEHAFCAISHGGAVSKEISSMGRGVEVLGVNSRIPSFDAIYALVKKIRIEKPDVIHTRGAEANFHGLIAAALCRVPVRVAEEIGFPNHSTKARFIFRQVYRLAHTVVAISEAVKNKLIDLGEISENKATVVLNPVEMDQRAVRVSRPSKTVKISFVGRLEEVKNPVSLVRAAALLRSRGVSVKVVIVGDGTQRELLLEEIDRLKLDETVVLAGFLSRPFDEIGDSTFYIQPSLSEGFGLAIVEAMAAEIPVLCTSVGGTREIIEHGKNGWFLRDTEPQTIATQLEELLALGQERLVAVGRAGRASVIERFSPQVYFDSCDKVYKRFLQYSNK